VELLNPVLEEMVAEAIHKMPKDPIPFMLEWLENKRVVEEDKDLTVDEKDTLAKENQSLQAEIESMKGHLSEVVNMANNESGTHGDEEEEDDDDDDEPPPDFERPMQAKARQSVSAEAYGEWNAKKEFVAPVIIKTDAQKDRLKEVLKQSFLFANLDTNELNIVIGAMKEVKTTPGHSVIKQGDDGNFMFVIESGDFDCSIKGEDGNEKVVKTCSSGDYFGELAVLYSTPRAASVVSKGDGVCWQLDRDTFNHIVKGAASKKRDRYTSFLGKVSMLQNMDAYERSQIADALRSEEFPAGATIMTQGECGDKFFIIEEGDAVASKGGVEVMNYSTGDYFGELALIRNQARAATVTAKTALKVLTLDAGSFKRLLDVSALLGRADNKYT